MLTEGIVSQIQCSVVAIEQITVLVELLHMNGIYALSLLEIYLSKAALLPFLALTDVVGSYRFILDG